jgi:hypothetical protein
MTEVEWLNSSDPLAMTNCWGPSQRKLRLLICACIRRAWHLLADERSRQAVEVSEAFADEPRRILYLLDAQEAAGAATSQTRSRHGLAQELYNDHFLDDAPDNDGPDLSAEDGYRAYAAVAAASDAVLAAEVAWWAAAQPLELRHALYILQQLQRVLCRSTPGSSVEAEKAAQAQLVREIAGNPLRRPRLKAEWLNWNGGTIPRIAGYIYDERAFHELPVLGDALFDAGCTDPVVLEHCRQPNGHVRGCWLLDAILGLG